jgi:two-component system, NarL family, response regulator DevR
MTSESTAPTTVFLLDDHELVRRGLFDLLELEDDLEVVGEASTAAEALARIPAVRPDVAVLDVRLPDGNGIEVCREIRSLLPDVHCLMLTSYADDEAMVDALLAGAAGYVLKDIRGADLVGAVRRVARGESLLDPKATERVLHRLRGGEVRDERLDSLTGQERRILDLIGEGMTNRPSRTTCRHCWPSSAWSVGRRRPPTSRATTTTTTGRPRSTDWRKSVHAERLG